MLGVVKKTSSWHLQISKCKRFYIKRTNANNVILRGECVYRSDLGMYKNVFIQGKRARDLIAVEINIENSVSTEKKKRMLISC